jgi:hypothetical protein
MLRPWTSLLLLASARAADDCRHNSVCGLGSPKNVTNATGLCINNPFYPGTKKCEVCDGCPWPDCPCCNPLYDDPTACSLCQVQDSYFRSKCGNPTFAYKCDPSLEANPCLAVPGTVASCNRTGYICYATQTQCAASCGSTYNCLNSDKCVLAPKGTVGKYGSLSACQAACGKPAPTPAPKPHYDNPANGCLPDEDNLTIYGVQGDICASDCTSGAACPRDVPDSVTAKPVCWTLIGGAEKCVLRCTPYHSDNTQCGTTATCKAYGPSSPLPSVGICTYGIGVD